MRTIAIGPETNAPSWRWVGFDTARELSKYYNVLIFSRNESIPACDALLIVKGIPPLDEVINRHNAGTRISYAPIDNFQTPHEISDQVEFLDCCSTIFSHSQALTRYLSPFCENIIPVDHNGKFYLPSIRPWRHTGSVLWVGAMQYVCYLIKWLEQFPLDLDIRILTNTEKRHVQTCRIMAERLGVKFEMQEFQEQYSINGYKIYQWTERRQYEMMMGCRAAIDIKGGYWNGEDWAQLTKPPTKSQKYIASGIPFATNGDSTGAEYFRRRGFEIASPHNPKWWLSSEYWEQTAQEAQKLRQTTTLEAVGKVYRDGLDRMIDG